MDSHIAERVIGIAIIAAVCFDVFHSIIAPRLTLRQARIAPVLLGRLLWPSYRTTLRALPEAWRTGWLEMFAPLAFICLLVTWLLMLIAGFAFVIYSFGDAVKPQVNTLADAAYFAGTSVLTLGFGDVVAAEWPARFTVLLAAVLGLIFMALAVSLLFSMLSYLQQREQVVNTLMSRAGSPPSGVVILMRYRELNIVPSLSSAFVTWESWLAAILESHRAFPLLLHFRSQNYRNSWLAAIGATLDTASLLLTTVKEDWIGEADLYYWMGVSALKALAENAEVPSVEDSKLTKEEFKEAVDLLRDAGFEVQDIDKAWPYFQARRKGYMQYLSALAQHFEIPCHVWLPDLFKALK